ncbi:hypothetical protein JVU11DRAFT_3376 [Chiua virens]|nr:hypothetical protein JVU11DRAFT_3376 [Chiua virens]
MAEIDDAIKQLQTGSVHAPADLALLALAPGCTMEQCQLIMSAFYDVLDDAHLQTSKTDKSLPFQQVACLTSMATIVVKRYACPEVQDTLLTLAHHWPAFHQWILYLKSDFVDQESVDLEFRLQARRAIVDFLGICDDSLPDDTFDIIVSSPGIIATLFSLWHLETQDKRFSVSGDSDPSYHPTFQIPATLDSWMCAFSHRETWHWPEFLRAFGGDAGALATTALDHLRQDIACEPTNYDLIIWDIHLMTTLSINDSIRIPFLTHQSLTTLSTVVNSLVGRYATTDQHSLVAKCISYGYWYIRAYAESTEGLPWIIQIVEADLLPTLLSTEPWIKHLGGQDHEDWEPLFLLLGQIIPKYSVYNSVLKPMIKQLAVIDASGLAGKLDKNGLLFQCWTVFETIVRNRATLYNSALGNETHIESCQNEKVCLLPLFSFTVSSTRSLSHSATSPGRPGHSKAAQGASMFTTAAKNVKYTIGRTAAIRSIAVTFKLVAQVSKRPIGSVETLNTASEGLISRLSKRDVRFLDRVIAQDLTLFRDRIQVAAATTPSPRSGSRRARLHRRSPCRWTLVPSRRCQGSRLAHVMPPWLRNGITWSSSRKSRRQSGSSCAHFYPAGTSERMKLQCLPLKRILGESAPSTDEEPMSEFDDTFDLLYSRAGQSFGVVDAAFPSEAIRALREKTGTEEERLNAPSNVTA